MPAQSKEHGLRQLQALVARFADNEPHFTSAEFDETSTREQFINALFGALGWDLLDEGGVGAGREVVFHPRFVEEPELAGEAGWDEDLSETELAAREPVARVPDYAFRVDFATRFFVEAKRAGRSIDTRPSILQVKSYAWSERVRIGVLTNFRRLRVYQCLTRPTYDDPQAGLLADLDLGYADYEANWDRIWDLLSREAVIAGSIEALGRAPRGSLTVDEGFLVELTEWRARLAQDLLDLNPDLTRWELAEATQRILDRLVFLRVCEDRTVEQQVVLRRYARLQDAYRNLCTEFRRLDHTYNGALFAEHFSERLELSDGVIQRLIASLYFPSSPYRFNRIDVELLGAAYERFLGKELTVDDNECVQLEDKPEVLHAGGVYYTPRWIVDEIVSGALDPLLADRTPQTAEGLRIVDPACGSGSFLIGALDYLIEWHERYYAENPGVNADRHYLSHDGTRRLTSDAKAAIVKQSIYGVDIDPQAVEVAQMSLYLKILEAETDATLHQHMRLFPGPYLPSLSENVRCGNSLLGPADVPQALLFDEELRRRINPFDWRDDRRGFGAIFSERGGFDAVVGNPPYTRVQVLRRARPQETELYERRFATAEAAFDIASLFVEQGLGLLRPRRGGDQGGRLGFIITRTFCETDAGKPLRRLLSEGRHVSDIIDFGSGLVFENAAAYTLILRATTRASQRLTLTRVLPPPLPATLRSARAVDSPLTGTLTMPELGGEAPWPLLLPAERELLERLAAHNPSLGDITGNQIFQGLITGSDGTFRCWDAGPDPSDPSLRRVVPQRLGETADPIPIELAALRPVAAGSSDIRRFRWAPPSQWVIFPYERDTPTEDYRGIPASRLKDLYPLAYTWLESHREALLNRAPQTKTIRWNDENWPHFSRRQNLERFGEPKVLVPYMVDQLCGVYDPGANYLVNVSTGGYGLGANPDHDLDPEYVAALLNSELLSWALKRYGRAFRGDYTGARAGNLRILPIAVATPGQCTEIVNAYRDCCQAAEQLDAARTDADKEMLGRLYAQAVTRFDPLVMSAYGITPAEIAVVRSA